jgi:hypothetical protein
MRTFLVTARAPRGKAIGGLVAGAALTLGCSDAPAPDPSGGDDIKTLEVTVPASGRAFVELATPAAAAVDGDGATSTAWDMALEGYEVFTNGGLSGPGEAGALGPYAPEIFDTGVDPGSPILTRDAVGGAFLLWYGYDYTNPAHALFSRYHVFGVRDGDRLWKVQILSYYGDVEGAPVSAMYRLRYAELTSGGALPTQEVANLDGTAGGATGSDESPSECLDLGTGARVMLAPSEAVTSPAWHLCFRREVISVNGELGGPRGVAAVDLHGAETPFESAADLEGRTAESELGRFEAATFEALSDPKLAYRGDRVVSIFSDQWVDPKASPPAPLPGTWVVLAAGGEQRFMVSFTGFAGPSEATPGKVAARVRPVKK